MRNDNQNLSLANPIIFNFHLVTLADMTKPQRSLLVDFMLATAMYTGNTNPNSIMCFVQGFVIGAKCDFLETFRAELELKSKLPWPSNGLIGQIEVLAKRKRQNWDMTFRTVALELLTRDESALNKQCKNLLINTILVPIEITKDFNSNYHNFHFSNLWEDRWMVCSFLKHDWFRKMWSNKEWKLIREIDLLVRKGMIFEDPERTIPSVQLVDLCKRFAQVFPFTANSTNKIIRVY